MFFEPKKWTVTETMGGEVKRRKPTTKVVEALNQRNIKFKPKEYPTIQLAIDQFLSSTESVDD